jgi:hypothetical protein
MKIEINVHRINLDQFYQARYKPLKGREICSCLTKSFAFTLVDIGDKIADEFKIDILSDEHELTIKLLK